MSGAPGPFNQMTRRHWLGHLASTALGVPAIQFFSSLQANAQQLKKANRSCIVLWMGGGPSHLDIWDLKPDSEKNGGPFKPIATSASGVMISEHLPKVAKQMHHLNIIRSVNSKEGNHDRKPPATKATDANIIIVLASRAISTPRSREVSGAALRS